MRTPMSTPISSPAASFHLRAPLSRSAPCFGRSHFLVSLRLAVFVCWSGFCLLGQAADFTPDPWSVQRFEKGYRYPQEGWTVVHIEGAPYERGLQHGRLLAPEIAAYIRCLATSYGYKAPAESWSTLRQLTSAHWRSRRQRSGRQAPTARPAQAGAQY